MKSKNGYDPSENACVLRSAEHEDRFLSNTPEKSKVKNVKNREKQSNNLKYKESES